LHETPASVDRQAAACADAAFRRVVVAPVLKAALDARAGSADADRRRD
jgi:hypothetical protein